MRQSKAKPSPESAAGASHAAPAAKRATIRRKREKLPSFAELKRQLDAISDTAVARAKVNCRKYFGRDML